MELQKIGEWMMKNKPTTFYLVRHGVDFYKEINCFEARQKGFTDI